MVSALAILASGCFGKIAHATASGAHVALRRMLRRKARHVEHGRILAVYRCAACQQWHVGNTWK